MNIFSFNTLTEIEMKTAWGCFSFHIYLKWMAAKRFSNLHAKGTSLNIHVIIKKKLDSMIAVGHIVTLQHLRAFIKKKEKNYYTQK